ncbi:MAG: protocatechuate 3,4-dioxygenase subunit alpha [Pseudomonadota bacterium]
MRPNTKIMPETASQTAGPYVHIGLAPNAAGFDIYEREAGAVIADPSVPGERIRVEGIVWDGNGEPVKDVLLEVWQADAAGRHANADAVPDGFRGWGRIISDFDTGIWSFDTIKPGRVGSGAPYLSLWIVARGINIGLNTRMYFGDEAAANASDPVLAMIEDEAHRGTLVAPRSDGDNGGAGGPLYRFDIVLQGDGETVFFDV